MGEARPQPRRERTSGRSGLSVSTMLGIMLGVLVIGILYFAREILVPLALAVLLGLLLGPPVRFLQRIGIHRVPAVLAVVFLACLVLLGVGGVVTGELASLGEHLPEYQSNIEQKIRAARGGVPGVGAVQRAAGMLRDLGRELDKGQSGDHPQPGKPEAGDTQAGRKPAAAADKDEPPKPVPVEVQQPALSPLQVVRSVVGPLLSPLATGGMVLVFVIFFLLKREDLRDRMVRLTAPNDLHRSTVAMNDAAQRISRYLLMQLSVNIIYGIPTGIGLTLIGVPNAALWGLMTAILRFIPYLGVPIAAVFPLALAVAVDPGWSMVLWVMAQFIIIEAVIGYGVEPWLYGDSTGMSLGRRHSGGDLLDLAVGSARAAVVGTADGLPRRARAPCPAIGLSRGDARQRARAVTR